MIKVWNLGRLHFETAFKIQSALARKLLQKIAEGENTNHDIILLVEHNPVYTVGIRDKTPMSEIKRLNLLGAEFCRTNRGGLITFHGPGQLVAYPILNLKHFEPSVRWYVHSLEQTIINLCHELGMNASRSPHTGVWIKDNKISAIGIHASRYVTTHGISLNCDNDLTWFNHITPCGIEDKGVTSLSKETGITYSIQKTIPLFLNHFCNTFSCQTELLEKRIQEEILSSVVTDLMDHQHVKS